MTKILDLRQITVAFGGLLALQDVDLSVDAGELISVIGPNGAGKSTLFNVATGVIAPTSGTLTVCGQHITRFRPDVVHALGVGRTFQVARPIISLTVRENVLLGAGGKRLKRLTSAFRARSRDSALADRVDDLLSLAGLQHVAERSAGELSPGDQRRLEIARAMADEPSVVLLDEPAAGIGADGIRPLGNLIRAIQARGVAVLLVEHNVGLALSLCDRALVLESGRVLAEGTPEAIRQDERVIAAYLGTRRPSREPGLSTGEQP